MSQATNWGLLTSAPATRIEQTNRINAADDALLTGHLGASRPSYLTSSKPGEWWKDVSSTIREKYYWDGTQDVLLGTENPTTGAWVPALPASGVTAGSYTNASVTVDAQGRVTAASSGAASGGGVVGAFSNLVISTTGTNATVTVSADEVCVEDSSNSYQTIRGLSVAINTASSGAGGLDTGSLTITTIYYVWAIAKADGTKSAMISLSATAPTMPTGYTFKALLGFIKTDSSGDKYPFSMLQKDRVGKYVVASGSNVTTIPILAAGTTGTYSTTAPTWASVSLGLSSLVKSVGITGNPIYGGSQTGNGMVAPSSTYGGQNSANYPPMCWTPLGGFNLPGEIVLETANTIYAALQNAGSAISLNYWRI